MKIVYLVSQFPSLTETFIAREINQMVELGQDVTICIMRGAPASGEPKGMEVQARKIRAQQSLFTLFGAQLAVLYRQPMKYLHSLAEAVIAAVRRPRRALHVFYLLLIAAWFAKILEKDNIEYIHCHFLHNEAIASRWLARFLNVPFGITSHVSSIRHDPSLIKEVVKQANVLIGDTNQTLSVYQELAGKSAILIQNGIKLDEFHPLDRSKLFTQNIPLIIAVGSLVYPKGHHILIRACEVLKKEEISFHCNIIGEGPERSNLENLVNESNLNGNVTLAGALTFTELRTQYAQAAMLVMPSIPSPKGSDGLPTVLIEAMALGVPVIGSNHAGIPDLIRPLVTGLLVEPGDPESLAKGIKELLQNDPLRHQMVINGRKRIEDYYDLRRNAMKLLQLIEQTTERPIDKPNL